MRAGPFASSDSSDEACPELSRTVGWGCSDSHDQHRSRHHARAPRRGDPLLPNRLSDVIRRRPVPVYELLSEDELLAAAPAGPQSDRPPGPQPLTAGLDARAGRGEALRTLAIALAAAALVGLAVWELLGLAREPRIARTPLPVVALARPEQLGGQRRAQVRSAPRPLAVARSARSARIAGPGRAVSVPGLATTSDHPRANASTTAARSTDTAVGSAPAPPAPSPPVAWREFGFER